MQFVWVFAFNVDYIDAKPKTVIESSNLLEGKDCLVS